jgi:hypothetical protein
MLFMAGSFFFFQVNVAVSRVFYSISIKMNLYCVIKSICRGPVKKVNNTFFLAKTITLNQFVRQLIVTKMKLDSMAFAFLS